MLTEEVIAKLKRLIEQAGGEDERELREALDDVGRVIGTQALLIRNLKRRLDGAMITIDAISQKMNENTLSDLFSKMATPKRNRFTVEEAVAASEGLVGKVRDATNFAEIFKAVLDVAKVLI